jgi:rhodanese-related sulfurtransferase
MSANRGDVVDLDREEVKCGLADGSLVLVDVREPHEFAAGHIPGSVSHPLSQFDPAALPAAGGRRIVFSCAAGVRSVRAIEWAQAAGLDLNEHYRGGFKDWAAAGEPVA